MFSSLLNVKCLEQRSHLSTLEVFIAISAVRFIWDMLDCYSELRFTITSWQCYSNAPESSSFEKSYYGGFLLEFGALANIKAP